MLEASKAAAVAELDMLAADHSNINEIHSMQLLRAQAQQQHLEDRVVDAVDGCRSQVDLVMRKLQRGSRELLEAEIHRLQVQSPRSAVLADWRSSLVSLSDCAHTPNDLSLRAVLIYSVGHQG